MDIFRSPRAGLALEHALSTCWLVGFALSTSFICFRVLPCANELTDVSIGVCKWSWVLLRSFGLNSGDDSNIFAWVRTELRFLVACGFIMNVYAIAFLFSNDEQLSLFI